VCCCCGEKCKGRLSAQEPKVSPDTGELREKDGCYKACCYAKWSDDANLVEEYEQRTDGQGGVSQMRFAERFFHSQFSKLIIGSELESGKLKPFAYLFIVIGFAYGAFMIYGAAQLTPPTAQEEWFPKQHMYTDMVTRLTSNWQGGAESDYMQIAIVFGVATYERYGSEERDIEGFNWYFPKEDRGLVTYDSTYNMTKEASQRFFVKTCEEIKEIKCSSPACQKGDMLRVEAKPTCVMQDLLDFYRLNTGDTKAEFVPEDKFDSNYQTFIKGEGKWNKYYSTRPDNKTDFSWLTLLDESDAKYKSDLKSLDDVLKTINDGITQIDAGIAQIDAGIAASAGNATAIAEFEAQKAPLVAQKAGLVSAKADLEKSRPELVKLVDKLPELRDAREQVVESFQGKYQQVIGREKQWGKTYDWAMIEFRSSITTPISNGDAHAAFDDMEAWLAQHRQQAPAGMRTMFQTDTLVPALGWTWMQVEDALVRNLMVGFGICFPVAYVVLIAATGNIIVGTYAIVSIAFIVAGVLGAARLYSNWSLGVAESIAGVIVIGFSVDYTVHLGHIYREAGEFVQDTREHKTQHALTVMGTTVIGGGLTTLSAGLILYMCTLTFFTKMAALLVWTIVLSIIYSLVFFTSLLAVFGPSGDVGSVYTLCGLLKPKKD